MSDSTELTGIILAGGEGRRMQGLDKGWIDLAGKPLIQHVLTRILPQVEHCIISANRNLERYALLGHPVVHDNEVYLGPLAGIATALEAISTEYALIVPTDAPLLPLNLRARLLGHNSAKLVVCHDGERLQPLFGLYHRSLAHSIRHALAQNHLQLTRWCHENHAKTVTISDKLVFANLNTADELAQIQALLTHSDAQ